MNALCLNGGVAELHSNSTPRQAWVGGRVSLLVSLVITLHYICVGGWGCPRRPGPRPGYSKGRCATPPVPARGNFTRGTPSPATAPRNVVAARPARRPAAAPLRPSGASARGRSRRARRVSHTLRRARLLGRIGAAVGRSASVRSTTGRRPLPPYPAQRTRLAHRRRGGAVERVALDARAHESADQEGEPARLFGPPALQVQVQPLSVIWCATTAGTFTEARGEADSRP